MGSVKAIKHGRSGKPQTRFFSIQNSNTPVWHSKPHTNRNKATTPSRRKKAIRFKDVKEVRKGKTTDIFKRSDNLVAPSVCLSLVMASKKRSSIDLQFNTTKERDTIARGLSNIVASLAQGNKEN